MNLRIVRGAAAITMLFVGRAAMAQVNVSDQVPKLSVPLSPAIRLDSPSAPQLSTPETNPLKTQRKPPVGFSRARFLLLSSAVYGAALADMHQTLQERNYSWWYETDPLAKPLVRLPTPTYYATGLALATGVNWVSWKMAHSRRWHKFSPIPQLVSVSGNLYGFQTNLH